VLGKKITQASKFQHKTKDPIRWSYEPYYFSERTIFFSHNKLANSTFSHGLLAKRRGHIF